MITSLQNQRVKDAAKLRTRRQRERQGRILIDGAREIARALEAGVDLPEAFVCPPLCDGTESGQTATRLREAGVEIVEVSEAVFAKLAFGDRAEGVVGVAVTPEPVLEEIVLPESPLVFVLEGVEKPGNVGAMLRSADAAGVAAVIVANGATDLYNPNCIRASLGTVFTTAVCGTTSELTLDWLRARRLQILAARVGAERTYTDVDLTQPTAVVLGAEATGLSDAWNADDVTPIGLPMHGVADSLNVSATAAIIAYEALRQRGPA